MENWQKRLAAFAALTFCYTVLVSYANQNECSIVCYSMEREEILFDVAFGNEKGKGELSRQRSGNWDVYVNNRAYGSIIKYDGGWMVMLRGDEFNQGDADELLAIAGISLEEKYPVDGFVERKPAYKIKDAYKTMWPDCPIYGKDKSPD